MVTTGDSSYDTARHIAVLYQNHDIEEVFREWYRKWFYEPIYTVTFNNLMAVRRFMNVRAVLVYDKGHILQYAIIALTRSSRGQQEAGVTAAISIPSIYEQHVPRYDKTAEGHPLNGIYPVLPLRDPTDYAKQRAMFALKTVWSRFTDSLTTL